MPPRGLPAAEAGRAWSQPGEEVGDLHGGGHAVSLLGPPVLAQGNEHARVAVALIGIVVVGEEDLLELALIGEERLEGKRDRWAGCSVSQWSAAPLCLHPMGPTGLSREVRCRDLPRARRGTWPAHSSGCTSHLPDPWQPENFTSTGSALKDTAQGLTEGLLGAPSDGRGTVHSGMAHSSLFLSWGQTPCLGWPWSLRLPLL